jgi:uncharacterized NAD(P)/FAD-binding protein YdhS
MTDIAIIGAGFSGTLLALHLLRRCPPATRVHLIERNSQFGRGPAYSTGNPSHLLNVPAGKMSAFHDRPSDFLDWLRQQSGAFPDGVTPDERSFVPRQLFGAYVRTLLNQDLKQSRSGDRLQLIRSDASGLDSSGDRLQIRLDRDRTLPADLAVLAIGNFPPEHPPVADPSFFDGPLYRPDPWGADSFTDLDPAAPVLLIGTGLTMVDAVISLLDQGHRGPIHAVSRRGLRPHRHAAGGPPPSYRPPRPFPAALTALTRAVRRDSTRAAGEGANWRAVIDELRPFTQDLWQALSPGDRARFLRHLRPWWEIHRHRMPGEVADRIDAALGTGQLRLHAGRITGFEAAGGQVDVVYRPRHGDDSQRLGAVRVINCSGPGCDYDRISHPLIRSLLDRGNVRPDPLRLGLDVSQTCALKDRNGALSRRLFAIGPVTKGTFWEMTAVPDIRRQCEMLATHLASLAVPVQQPLEPAL